MLDVGETMIWARYCHDPVIAFFAFLVELFALNDSHETALHHDSRESGLIHQHQHIDGIAIPALSSWDESEIIRKSHASRQNFLQFKNLLFHIKCVFVPAAL